MATTMEVTEGLPATRPPLDPTQPVDPRVVWSRIEEWIAYRWGERPVSFFVEGFGGDWRAPLHPFTLVQVEAWDGGGWTEVELPAAPLGWRLGSAQYYRFTGTTGADETPPPEVMEAARRLQVFWASARETGDGSIGLASSQQNVSEGDLTVSWNRPQGWLGRAIHSSGAADLLRKYRRVP